MYTLVQQLNTIRNAKAKLRAEQASRKRAAYEKKKAKLDVLSEAHSKARQAGGRDGLRTGVGCPVGVGHCTCFERACSAAWLDPKGLEWLRRMVLRCF